MTGETNLAEYLSVIGVSMFAFLIHFSSCCAKMLNGYAALHQTAAHLTLPSSVLDRTGNKYCCDSL